MQGTIESHKQRVELGSRVQALWKTFEQHSKSAEGHKKVDDLKHQLKLLSAHKATIDQGFDVDEAGPRAVLHEVIAKTHHTLNTELRKVVPSAVNDASVHKINRLFRHMKHPMERYDLLDLRFKASSAIVQKVAKLNSKKLAGASIEALELQMGEIKKGNEKRKLDPEPKPTHQTAPQLASDITDLLKLSDDMRSKRLEMRDQLKDHLADAKDMKHNLARAQSQLSKIETVQEFQEAGLAKLHKHGQQTAIKASSNDDTDLGESMEDGGDSSVDALSTDIDSFLDDDNAAHEDDDPWLTDLIQISENSEQQDLSTTEQQEEIPFLTDEQSAKAFHGDSDSSLFAKHQAAAESEPEAAEPKEETKTAAEDDDATLEAAAKAAYESKHNEDDDDATEAVGEDNEATTEAAAKAAYEAKHNEDDNDDATEAVGEDNEATYQPSSQQRTDEPEAAATPDEGDGDNAAYEAAKQNLNAARQDDDDDDDYDNSEDEDPSFIPYQIN